MDSDNILNDLLETCFKSIENREFDKLKEYFMKRILTVYKYKVENKDTHSLQNLSTFLQHCLDGKWTDASSLRSAARKEYEKEFMKKEASHYRAQSSLAGTRELNDERHSAKEVEEKQSMMRSKEASILLKDNNPNIFDLSDPNNPFKLVERFSELYCNEYTDAFEELNENNKNNRPDEHIKFLLDIVKKARVFCMELRKQMIDEKMKSSGLSRDDQVKRYEKLSDLREAVKAELPSVQEKFMKLQGNAMRERTQKFARQCVEIVLLMCIQQPPVHLEWVENKREKFKADLYRGYTRSGDFVEFCVWPVVRLHEGGPILTRGIAQGCD